MSRISQVIFIAFCILAVHQASAQSEKVRSVINLLSTVPEKNLLNVDVNLEDSNSMSEEELFDVVAALYQENQSGSAANTMNYASLSENCCDAETSLTESIAQTNTKISKSSVSLNSMSFEQEYKINVFQELYTEFIDQEQELVSALTSVKGENQAKFQEFSSNVNEYLGNLYEIRGFIVSYDQAFNELDQSSNSVTDSSEDFLVQIEAKESNKNELVDKLKGFSFLQKNENTIMSTQEQTENQVMKKLETANEALIQSIQASSSDHKMNGQLLGVMNTVISGLESQLSEMSLNVQEVLSVIEDGISYHNDLIEETTNKLSSLDSQSVLIQTSMDSEEKLIASYQEELTSFQEEMSTEKAFCEEQLGFYEQEARGIDVMRSILVKSIESLGYTESDVHVSTA